LTGACSTYLYRKRQICEKSTQSFKSTQDIPPIFSLASIPNFTEKKKNLWIDLAESYIEFYKYNYLLFDEKNTTNFQDQAEIERCKNFFKDCFAEATSIKGPLLILEGKFETAKAIYKRNISINPWDINSLLFLVQTANRYANEENINDAIVAYNLFLGRNIDLGKISGIQYLEQLKTDTINSYNLYSKRHNSIVFHGFGYGQIQFLKITDLKTAIENETNKLFEFSVHDTNLQITN